MLLFNVFHLKNLGLIFDSILYFNWHIDRVLSKVNKIVTLLRKFQYILPQQSLLIIYKTFVRPHLDYGKVVYDKVFIESFYKKTWICSKQCCFN